MLLLLLFWSVLVVPVWLLGLLCAPGCCWSVLVLPAPPLALPELPLLPPPACARAMLAVSTKAIRSFLFMSCSFEVFTARRAVLSSSHKNDAGNLTPITV